MSAVNPFGRGQRSAAYQQVLSSNNSNSNVPQSPVTATNNSVKPCVPFGRGLRTTNADRALVSPAISTNSLGTTSGITSDGSAKPLNPFGRGFGRAQPKPYLAQPITDIGPSLETLTIDSPNNSSSPNDSGAPPTPTLTPPPSDVENYINDRYRRPVEQSLHLMNESTIGSMGDKMDLAVNFVKVECSQQYVYQYDVQFMPPVDALMVKRKLMLSIEDNQFMEGHVFNGRCLFLPKPLPQEEFVFRVHMPTDGSTISIKVRKTNVTPLASCSAVYNNIFRSLQRILRLVPLGRHYFDPNNIKSIPQHKLSVWPGYITSICQLDGGLMLLLDIAHRIVNEETVHDVMGTLSTTFTGSGNRWENLIQEAVVGRSVLTKYNNKIMMIDDIDFHQTPKNTFDRGGVPITYIEYYKTQYNIIIQDEEQPLLIHKPKAIKGEKPRLMCLIPELCYLTGLSDTTKNNFRIMKDLAAHTKLSPNRRITLNKDFIDSVNKSDHCRQLMKSWGISVSRDPLTVEGRTFKPEKILFKNNFVDAGPTADFKRSLNCEKFLKGVTINNWIVVGRGNDMNVINQFITTMIKRAKGLDIQMNTPNCISIPDDKPRSYLNAIQANFECSGTQLVVCVFPTQRDDRYSAIKKICCVDLVVPSQCLLIKTIGDPKKMSSVAVNVAAQINVKLGGELWGVKIPLKSFMCVGMDVYHQGKGAGRSSVCAVVASLNSQCTRWYSLCAFQKPGQELVDAVKAVFTIQLKQYLEHNGELPQTIFMYRDGVSDGMMGVVQQHEIPQLLSACDNFGNYKPNVNFSVVQKRVNQRIMRIKGSGNNAQFENPAPGSVLDHTITRPGRYDFFLVPQHVTQGTVTPSHYVVLFDSTNLSADRVQTMAFRQCHMYYNWPGTIRVPAPCQYAHKLAYMVGQNILTEPSHHLADRLFYL